jgi:hypothetical protein
MRFDDYWMYHGTRDFDRYRGEPARLTIFQIRSLATLITNLENRKSSVLVTSARVVIDGTEFALTYDDGYRVEIV